MPDLPPAEVYERELVFMPYKKSLAAVCNSVCTKAPQNGKVLDLMSGPGYLLNQIKSRRPDLTLKGVDIEPSYIDYARSIAEKQSIKIKNNFNKNKIMEIYDEILKSI